MIVRIHFCFVSLDRYCRSRANKKAICFALQLKSPREGQYLEEDHICFYEARFAFDEELVFNFFTFLFVKNNLLFFPLMTILSLLWVEVKLQQEYKNTPLCTISWVFQDLVLSTSSWVASPTLPCYTQSTVLVRVTNKFFLIVLVTATLLSFIQLLIKPISAEKGLILKQLAESSDNC